MTRENLTNPPPSLPADALAQGDGSLELIEIFDEFGHALERKLGEPPFLLSEGALQIDRFAEQRLEVERAAFFPGLLADCLLLDRALEIDQHQLQGRRANDEVVQLRVA